MTTLDYIVKKYLHIYIYPIDLFLEYDSTQKLLLSFFVFPAIKRLQRFKTFGQKSI